MLIQKSPELSKTQNQLKPERKRKMYVLTLLNKIHKIKGGRELNVTAFDRNQKILQLLKNL